MPEILTFSLNQEIPKDTIWDKIKNLWQTFQARTMLTKFSLVTLVVILLITPIIIAQQTNLFTHASTSLFTNCTPIPTGLTQQQIQQLAKSGKVQWCTSTNTLAPNSLQTTNISLTPTQPRTLLTISNIVALGDSITVGYRDCTWNPTICQLEPNSYVYLYASSMLPSGHLYSNYGYAGTTAACAGTCPTSDTINTDSTAFKTAYVTKTVSLPSNQSVIEQPNNMVSQTAPGIVRSNLGEFDNLSHADVVIAWGRNDVDTPSISLAQYKSALEAIALRVRKNVSNFVTFLTISPMDAAGWAQYQPSSSRRHEFDDRLANQSYPVELDAFFSAQEWEAAYDTNSYIAPLNEYFARQQTYPNYLSSDHLHPSAAGQKLIAQILTHNAGRVRKTIVTNVPVGEKFLIIASAPTYGQIVSQENGQFYYSEPFYADATNPYIVTMLTNDVAVYSNAQIIISPTMTLDTQTQYNLGNGQLVDSVTAYGKGWNWNSNNLPWVNSNLANGFDLTTIPHFAKGPCLGQAYRTCKFDTRAQWNINGQLVESITAYGKGYNYDISGNPWPADQSTLTNGFNLRSISRFANGPCLNKPDPCTFDTRVQYSINGQLVESITAYGKGYNFDMNGNPWPTNQSLLTNGFDLTSIPRFVQGPCQGKTPGTCTFDTRAQFNIGGQLIEEVTAYGKEWRWDANGNLLSVYPSQ